MNALGPWMTDHFIFNYSLTHRGPLSSSANITVVLITAVAIISISDPQTHEALLSLMWSFKTARSSVTSSLVRHACVIALKVTACSYCH